MDPIQKFKQALAEAENHGIQLANAFCLGTVDKDGHPANRVLLLKDVNEQGFVFYTNFESAKSADLASTPFAAMCFWWDPLQLQIRVRGPVTKVDDAAADAYFATRPRGSQIGAWASKQSAVLSSRAELEAATAEIKQKYEGRDVPRPPHWSGYVVAPQAIEFWYGREDRLHDRHLFTRRDDGGWDECLLNP